MAELSPVDVELLRQDLPNSFEIAAESPIYSDRRGLIEYRAAGDRGKPTVVLLHGLGSSSAGYRAQLAGLSRDFHVVAWNAPGFGASSQIGAQDVSVDHYADTLEAFVRALRVERLAAPVGSSWGSVIAVAFTKRYSQHVGGLVLSAPNAAKGRMTGEARDAELDAWLRTADISIPVSRAAIAERLLAPEAPALVRALVESLRDAMTTGGWRQAIRSLFTIYTPDVIPAVKRPIVVLSGALDRSRLTPSMQNASSPQRLGSSRVGSTTAVTFSSSKRPPNSIQWFARGTNKTFTALKCRNIRKGRLKCRLSISNGRTLSVTSC
jgi:pimeloyl-ACP methyl ester carboxylesterase